MMCWYNEINDKEFIRQFKKIVKRDFGNTDFYSIVDDINKNEFIFKNRLETEVSYDRFRKAAERYEVWREYQYTCNRYFYCDLPQKYKDYMSLRYAFQDFDISEQELDDILEKIPDRDIFSYASKYITIYPDHAYKRYLIQQSLGDDAINRVLYTSFNKLDLLCSNKN